MGPVRLGTPPVTPESKDDITLFIHSWGYYFSIRRKLTLPGRCSSSKGEIMAVKVLITRRLKEGKLNDAYKVLLELRSLATLRHGYVSGQTLISSEDHHKLLVISTWTSEKRWQEWRDHEQRKDFSKRLELFLESPEKVEIYLVGEKLPEWVDMA